MLRLLTPSDRRSCSKALGGDREGRVGRGPVTLMRAVTPPALVSATRSSSGVTSRSNRTRPRVKTSRVVRLAFDGDDRNPITMEFRKARLRTPETMEQFKPCTIYRGEDGWTSDAVKGKPKTGRKSDDVAKVKRAIADAYERLADSVDKTPASTASRSRRSKSTSCATRSNAAAGSTPRKPEG